MNIEPRIIFFALLGGILPSLLWLWFWLKEDSKKPEPKGLIALSFIAGMVSVAIVFPIEKFVFQSIPEGTLLFVIWAAIEEIVKFIAIFFIALRSSYFDEPVDALIYMITVALGFAALENSLFLMNPLMQGDVTSSIIMGNLRYLGATLLHVVASSSIGIAIGLSFYKSKLIKVISITAGLTTAIVLHSLFNFSIINNSSEYTFLIFSILWVAVVIVLFSFERVRRIKR